MQQPTDQPTTTFAFDWARAFTDYVTSAMRLISQTTDCSTGYDFFSVTPCRTPFVFVWRKIVMLIHTLCQWGYVLPFYPFIWQPRITKKNCRQMLMICWRVGCLSSNKRVDFFCDARITMQIQEFLTEFLPLRDRDNANIFTQSQ